MKILICTLIVVAGIGGAALQTLTVQRIAVRYPASASDWPNFYRAIQALSANPLINETAVATV